MVKVNLKYGLHLEGRWIGVVEQVSKVFEHNLSKFINFYNSLLFFPNTMQHKVKITYKYEYNNTPTTNFKCNNITQIVHKCNFSVIQVSTSTK